MKFLEKTRNYFFVSYGEWFLNQISNDGLGFAFVDRQLAQNLESKEARLTLTLFDASYHSKIEIEIEKTLVRKLGIGIPTGFQQVDLLPTGRDKNNPGEIRFCKRFNKTHVRWVANDLLKPNSPRNIIFTVEHLEKGYGRITIGLPYKLGFGCGSLNANTLVGLSNPEEIDSQTERWKDLKAHWVQSRKDLEPDQNSRKVK